MSEPVDLVALARASQRYAPDAFALVGEGLRHAVKTLGRDHESETAKRHLDAGELVEGVLDVATEQFGLLAGPVLAAQGLHGPEDVGRVTFLLIDHGIFSRQPSDRFEDFLELVPFSIGLAERQRQRLERVKL
jgi:uncharacterized repeat protein (TIGR04138 family)